MADPTLDWLTHYVRPCNVLYAHVTLFINNAHITLIIALIELMNLMIGTLPLLQRIRFQVQILGITSLNNGD